MTSILKRPIQTLLFTILSIVSLYVPFSFADSFKFVAYGDMPYNIPADFARYERLIQTINTSNPEFVVFVGDTKSSSTPCSNEYNTIVKNYFNQFNQPLIYSVGDNEWTDCHTKKAGSYNPMERLNNLRQTFFNTKQSFGKKTLPLTRQADTQKEFSDYVENSYWINHDFLFVSLNISGTNNNLGVSKEGDVEYQERNLANLAWIKYCSEIAVKKNLSGIIFAYQADMFSVKKQAREKVNGYLDTVNAITSLAINFSKPILLMHGDSHRLIIDQPITYPSSRMVVENVLRLQLMGEDEVQAVEVTINSDLQSPFSFRPIIIPENHLKP